MKKPKHGGLRAGAGRKAQLKAPVKLLITVEQQQADKLDRECASKKGTGRAEVIRKLIDTNLS